MKHGSLFSGIGGFDLAAKWMGWDNVFHCDINPFCRKVLKYHFPKSIIYEDICKTDFTIHRGQIDIISGGFPCQPFSTAGKRLGKADERYLWKEMHRAIKEIEPTYIVGENVLGIVNWNKGMVFQEVCSEMEDIGYEVFPVLLAAASVNAPHKRQRMFFIATHTKHNRKMEDRGTIAEKERNVWRENKSDVLGGLYNNGISSYTKCTRLEHRLETGNISSKERKTQKEGGKFTDDIEAIGYGIKDRWEKFPTITPICGGDDGIPKRLDNISIPKWRKESLKAYGNAVVPQLVYNIFKTIEDIDELYQLDKMENNERE